MPVLLDGKMEQKYIVEPDSRYASLGVNNFNSYCERYKPDFTLIKTVDEHVQNEIQIVEQLFNCGYIYYPIVDEALSKLTRTMELALLCNFKQITGHAWSDMKYTCKFSKRNLKNLIIWTYEQRELDTNESFIQGVRDILRNPYAHPNQHSFGGVFVKHWFPQILGFINELFEPEAQRKERTEFANQIDKSIVHLKSQLYIFEYQSKKILVQAMQILFSNVLFEKPITYIYCLPLFNLDELIQSDFALQPKVLFFELTDIYIINGIFNAQTISGESVQIYLNADVRNADTFENWKTKLFSIPEDKRAVINMFVNSEIEHYQQKIRMEYIKQFNNS